MTDKTDTMRAAWDDPDVQLVYKLICGQDEYPSASEHWDGHIARRIVAELRQARRTDADAGGPVFWYRPRSDGDYDGPIHDSVTEQIRKDSGVWVPLFPYAAPPVAAPVDELADTLAGWEFKRAEDERYWAVLTPTGCFALARNADDERISTRVLAMLAEALAQRGEKK